MAEYNGSGTLLRKYVYGPGLDEPIMMIVPGETSETVYYYHADSQGTIIGLTNDSGAWVEKYAYTLYGKPAAASTVGNPYMYTGRRLDAETGLYYYRARYYDPHLRRFIETDPIGYAGGMNLYAYVGNSPFNFIDPWGLYQSPSYLQYVPGQRYYDLGRTSIERGEYLNSAGWFACMVAEQVVVALTLGASSGISVGEQCVVRSTSTALASRGIAGFSNVESAIIREAGTILNSTEMATLRAAYNAGRSATVNIGGRIIQYEPSVPGSGMSMFGENGFLIGPEAYSSSTEFAKTVLHELYRLATSESANGVSAALASSEAAAASNFADRAIFEVLRLVK